MARADIGLGEGWSGAMAPSDVDHAGDLQWATMTGIEATNPLMGGTPRIPGMVNSNDPENALSRIVTTLPPDQAPAGAAGTTGPEAVDAFDDWRDLLDWRNSPAPWVLALALAAVGFVQLRVSARGGPANLKASLG